MTTTLLSDAASHASTTARADGDDLWLPAAELPAATGWTLKPEGFCQGDVCLPVPPASAAEFVRGDRVNVARLWRHIGAPVVHDAAGETWVLGASAESRAARLHSLEAPDFTLPDWHGTPHALSDYRGRKVLLVSWASW